MAKIVCDPISRLEGHLGAEIDLAAPGAYSAFGFSNTVGATTRVFSTMYRGFENILKGRDPRDAIQITQRICGVCPVPHGITATFAVENAMGYSDATIADNSGHSSGPNQVSRLVRNLTLGGEFMMSAITHFYALSALDLVQGPAMAPWTPFWDNSYYDPALIDGVGNELTWTGTKPDTIRAAVVTDYVLALRTRTKALDMGAIFGGRLPIASSFVAGGVTKIPTAADITNARALLADVKGFIQNNYIPMTEIVSVLHGLADNENNNWQNVLVGAGLQSASSGVNNRGPYSCRNELPNGLGLGRGCGNFYAAGGFDADLNGANNSTRLFPRGVVTAAGPDASGNYVSASSGVYEAVDPMRIRESIKWARYEQGAGNANEDLQPLSGVTFPQPDKASAYTWHKAPRYDGHVVEVGPLARMWVKGVNEGGAGSGYCYPMTKVMSSHAASAGSGVFNPLPAFGPGGVAATALGYPGGVPYTCGISVMDRHRARAREALLVANAIEGWLDDLQAIVGAPNWQATNARYTAAPHALEGLTAEGFGMAEAPRGAVHHWVKIKDGKIDNYQIQAPTTWNCSGRDSTDQPGPVEQALIGWPVRGVDSPNGIGAGRALVPVEAMIIVHSFDPCIACSIHVVDPKDKKQMKEFKVDKGGVE